MLGGAVFNGADGLAHLEFEVFEQRGELYFQFARAVAEFDVSFAGQLGAGLVQRILFFARRLALRFELRDLVV